MTGAELYQALRNRGYSDYHAAALAGNALQESGGDPTNVNRSEGAHGLWQFRGDRWTGLQNYALSRGLSPNDANAQIDFVAHEMAGPEAKSGAAFMAARDLPSASAALKGYIRWGDNSDATRLKYGQALLGGGNGSATPMAGPPTAPVASSSAGIPNSGGQPPAPEDPSLIAALQKIPKTLAQQQELPSITPIQMPDTTLPPNLQRARQMAQAMLSQSINPGATT